MTTSQADRQIKFRGRRLDTGEWVYGYYCLNPFFDRAEIYTFDSLRSYVFIVDKNTVGRFTGLFDKNGKEIYEHDIKRETIEYDEWDEVLYFVCVWIKEWAMFAWLAPDEYHDYINGGGVESLDMTMFCTYPAGADEPKMDITICGNIYQNSNLLQ